MNRKLRSLLRRRGATADEISRAERNGRLLLMAFDYELMPGRPQYTFEDVCRRASFDMETAKRLWRALGFPDPPADARLFRDDDVEAVITLRRQIETTIVQLGEDYEDLVQAVRAFGGALVRIAEVESDLLVAAVQDRREQGIAEDAIAKEVTEALDWPRLSRLIDYGLRLQLRAAIRRKLTASDPQATGAAELAVGFVDLVGYTALSQELEPEDLAALVSRFEELAYDTVAEQAGRVVKTIGDEVMFVAADAASAARIALRLTEGSAVDELLPDARAGLAYGSVLAQEGDYYGPVVNLASRLVERARPGAVLTSSEFRDVLGEGDAFEWQRLRPRRIRDIGRVEIWVLRRAEEQVPEP